LQARAGPYSGSRRDEVGEVIAEFDNMADRVEALVNGQRQLLNDISHELRSPLARANVALELARRKAGPEGAYDFDRIERETERMNELIGKILTFARLESNGLSRFGPLELGKIVKDVVADSEFEAEQQGKSVLARMNGPIQLEGDPELLTSAIENVVRNAIRYTPEGSSVTVDVESSDARAKVTVSDAGPGVPDSELEKMFSPFHRVGSSRDRESGGVGLGLSITQRAVFLHGGKVLARNRESGGLEVTITLPCRRAAAKSRA
jgi:two-component system sensor histidine kinase CpxA